MTREDAQAIYLEAKASLQQEALDGCWERYDLLPKVVGGAVAIGGALVLSAWLPGVGAYLAWSMAAAIAAGGTYVAGKEGASIERGDSDAISRYIDDERMEKLLSPFIERIQEGMAKKPLGAAETQTRTTPTTEPGSGRNAQTAPGSGSADAAPVPFVMPSRPPSWPDGEMLFMVGLSGASKTTALQRATAQITDPVVYLTIKTEDTAPPTWRAYRLEKFAGEKLLNQLLWVLDTLEGWVRSRKKHRLIIDEYVSIRKAARSSCKLLPNGHELKGLSDRLEDLVAVYIRSGRSDGHYLGLLSQTPNGTDNFDSAKTQQGLRVFLCASERSSEKFRFVVPWAKQMFSDLITPQVEEHLGGINSGYWHLFADGGELVLNATEKPTLEQVPCQECPTHFSTPSPGSEASNEWEAIALQLLMTDAQGLPAAASEVTGRKLSGSSWQKWRDDFKAILPTLDCDLQDQLRERFPSVLL